MSDLLYSTYADLNRNTGAHLRIGPDVHATRRSTFTIEITVGVDPVAIVRPRSVTFTMAGRAEARVRQVINDLTQHLGSAPELTQDTDGSQRLTAVIDDVEVSHVLSASDIVRATDRGVSIIDNSPHSPLSAFIPREVVR